MIKKSSQLGVLLLMAALVAVLAGCAPAAPAQSVQAPAQVSAATQAPAPTQVPTAAQPVQAPAPTQAPAATEPPAAAPTTAATEAPAAAAPSAAAVSFAADVKPILDQRCLKCHGGSDGTKGGLSMKSYDDLMAGGQDGAVVNPGDAANSMMVQAIVSGKMPKRATKLPQTEIDVISAWVAAGAKNN